MEVGQSLFYVPCPVGGRQPEPYEVVVTKVGRKWVTVKNPEASWDGFKIDKDTLIRDSGQYVSVGQCYHSKELYQEEKNRKEAWSLFRKMVSDIYYPPKHLSLRDIQNLDAKIYPRGQTGSLISGQDP